MKICIYGAGAVGSHFAVKLANAGETVSVVARGPHLEAIARDGIRLLTGGDEIRARPAATDDPHVLGEQSLVIVTLKAPSLEGIVDGIKPLLGPDTPVIFAMNGIPWWYFYGLDPLGRERRLERLDPGGRWWDEIGPERVIGGVVYSANEVTAPGVVENRSARNQLRIGEPTGEPSERVARINEVLERVEMAVALTDIRAILWEKLLGNIAFGPIACLTGATITDIRANPELTRLATDIMGEAIATASAVGTPLTVTAEERIGNTRSSGHKPSMLQDLERGRAMEIDAIATVPRDLARAAGLPTPALDRVLALLQERARVA
ncbi:MAG: 2-dehydropantoate 2-reductase, partial [Chromatiales bacterium]|nr:2-dehydropantoate 2-reductase [Chromatiales bacterium]